MVLGGGVVVIQGDTFDTVGVLGSVDPYVIH